MIVWFSMQTRAIVFPACTVQHFNIESLVSVCVGMSVALAAYSSHQCIHDPTRHPARLTFTPQSGSSVMRDRIVRSALIGSHNSAAAFQH